MEQPEDIVGHKTFDMGPLYAAKTGKPLPPITVREVFWTWLLRKIGKTNV